MKYTFFLLLLFVSLSSYSQNYEVKCCMSLEHELLLLGVDLNKEFDFLTADNIKKQTLAYDQQRTLKYRYFDGRVSEVYYSYTDEILKGIYIGVDYNVFRFAKPYFDSTFKSQLISEGLYEYNKLSKNNDEYSRFVGFIATIIDKEDLYIMLAYCKRNNYNIFCSQDKLDPSKLYVSIGIETDIRKLKSIELLTIKDIQDMQITICADCMRKVDVNTKPQTLTKKQKLEY